MRLGRAHCYLLPVLAQPYQFWYQIGAFLKMFHSCLVLVQDKAHSFGCASGLSYIPCRTYQLCLINNVRVQAAYPVFLAI